ncbi:ArsR/SmtB family transcription factor [Nocardia sp. NBC_01329]|uniref:ArsR/SmtB family transcription factor n=1 Tax=Nocardia sp. NBC_01329 TaxID=2903594 RepID=UPI002E141FA3|nr:metalloregulator ArsR/SmtB family transcription factor [Nocardia sp. NBC_01329]
MTPASPARVFEALGDPVRRAILRLMSGGERSAGALVEEIRAHTPISQPAVSQHLKVLREAGLVHVRSEANRRFYALEPAGIATAREWLAELVDPLEQFAQPLDALATEVARGKRARREKTPRTTRANRTGRTA